MRLNASETRNGRYAHALRVLEFDRALHTVAARAASEAGRRIVLGLRPRGRDSARRELARISALMVFLEERPGWCMPTVPSVADRVEDARVEGAALEPKALTGIGAALAMSRALGTVFRSWERGSALALVIDRLVSLPELEAAVDRAISPDGEVLDAASTELARLRSSVRGARTRIVRWMTDFVERLPPRLAVPGASLSLRDGRYVIPIRREGKGEVGGIVHDESRSGGTLFVEPPAAISLTNELRALERAEAREVREVLLALSAAVAPHVDEILGALEALAELDSLTARALAAKAWRAAVPELTDGEPLRISSGRHPLLVEGSEPVVPFDFSFDEGERVVIVSGPNAGGKSVFLKASGLICALAQSGVAPPVGPGTRLPAFGAFFADIGDEQSIAHSLSTFSAHLSNIARLLAFADARSLILLDELGTGTDPAEGAALARAVIEELVGRGASVIVTSHLSALKELATSEAGIVNASLEFDEGRMRPTYRLTKGRPGRSYALSLARTAGLPRRVLEKARDHLGDDRTRLEDLIARLERREREAASQGDELDAREAAARRKDEELERREVTLRSRERLAARVARKEARDLLMAARTEVEATIRELRRQAKAKTDLEAAARRARARVEAAAGRHAGRPEISESDSLPPGTVLLRAADLSKLAPGDEVVLRANGRRARVASVRDDRVVVALGGLRFDLGPRDIALPKGNPAGAGEKRAGGRRS